MRGLFPLFCMVFTTTTIAAAEPIVKVSNFDAGTLEAWTEKSFKGNTRYSLVTDEGRQVLRADSDASASGLFLEQKIDLSQTPCMTWEWKIDHILKNDAETTKAGDDYAARVYVVFSGGLIFWNTKAINYVWSSHQLVGATWPNAFSANATMVAVRSGSNNAGTWVAQQRNVQADYQRFIGGSHRSVDGVAIMTDTDNTRSRATAYYRNIRFTDGC